MTIGLACNGVFATVSSPITNCIGPGGTEGVVTSKLITLPQGGYGRSRARRMTTTIPTA